MTTRTGFVMNQLDVRLVHDGQPLFAYPQAEIDIVAGDGQPKGIKPANRNEDLTPNCEKGARDGGGRTVACPARERTVLSVILSQSFVQRRTGQRAQSHPGVLDLPPGIE